MFLFVYICTNERAGSRKRRSHTMPIAKPMKQSAQTDVAVLMLFFNRPNFFQQVFDQVRKARPSRLFLYQDGPRGDRDLPGIMACRDIVSDEQIDWECDVQRHYCERNQGCDPSEYLAQKWAFSMADKCIVLEDDDVPSQSFFPFCKEMLDRYADDPRVTMIEGFNIDEVTKDCPDSYFFTSSFAISGWASWRRVVDQWDADYAFMDDPWTVHQLDSLVRERRFRSDFLRMCRDHKAAGKPFYESIFWASMLLTGGLAIMPRVNLVSNIGLSTESTHTSFSLATAPKGYRRIFTMQRHELDFPLTHPRHLIENVDYKTRLYRTYAWGHPWIKIGRSFEELWLNLRHGNFGVIGRAIRHRVSKWMGTDRHI